MLLYGTSDLISFPVGYDFLPVMIMDLGGYGLLRTISAPSPSPGLYYTLTRLPRY